MKIQKIALITFITLLATIGQIPINRSAIVGITQASAQTPEARKAEADKLFQQGNQQYNNSDFEAALRLWQQALIIYQEIKNRQGEGYALSNIGGAYHALAEYQKAIDYFQQSLAIAKEIKDRKLEGVVLGGLGIAYHVLGNYKKAIDYHQQDLAIAKEIKNREDEGRALGNLGNAYYNLADYPKAIEYQQQSLAIAIETKDRFSQGKALGNLGVAYSALGNYKKAIEYYQQKLAITKEIKDRKGEAHALSSLGSTYYNLADYPKAIEYHQQSLTLAKKIKDRRGEARSLGSLGLVYRALGYYKKAIDSHLASLAIKREIQDRKGEGDSLSSLGVIYDDFGDYSQAIAYFQQSLAIFREIQNRRGEGKVLGNLGNAYFSLGDYKKALEYFQQRLAIAQQIKDRRGSSIVLANLGTTYHKLGDYQKAIDYQQQSLAIAREIQSRTGESNALGNLGNTYDALGNYPKAIEYHKQSLAIDREIKDRVSEGISLHNLGISFQKQGNLSAAEKTLYEGIHIWESLRDKELPDEDKISLFDTQRSTYRILQEVLIAQNKIDAALEIAERSRARVFVELLSSRISTNNKQTDKSTQFPTIAEIKQIAQQQNATLVQYSIIYDHFKIADRQQTKESDLYIWVVKPTGEVAFRKVDLKSLWQKDNTNLEELVTSSRINIGAGRGRSAGGIVAIQNPDAASSKKSLQRLHEILIKDIADLLPKKPEDRVIFIPQRSLFFAPFPALLDAKGKYLIEKHTILTAPAIQVLDFTHQLKRGRQTNYNNALIVGNPIMPVVSTEPGKPATKLDPLPGAELEAKTIAQMLKTQAILGKDATKANILSRLSSADVIHLATHGWADDYRGLGSWIALAPSSNDDGLLKAEEILDLKLKAQLVVLSACETGKGKLSGDGVIGLSRSLISAGVPSVLVSLWQVPDQPTQYLMVEFYKSLQTQPDKALALRQAMLKTKEKFPSAGDWAAFTLIGER
ncbi:CHAT domain-containing protein [Tolypothrix sp. FACHB-123]|uniref:CHAT domain-containing protein n=1 Tax=Tolypothrix sp. FACHB-123 TaxID=2692868 RepID=UPI0016888AF3|nr:CHAT domain-containing tetratricopeptide repeat protein [Tolypothrix sp. FACHB-123]MBD2356679.1 CHAT domain-containing protein [Tolypothrix sp. FACHB-123]